MRSVIEFSRIKAFIFLWLSQNTQLQAPIQYEHYTTYKFHLSLAHLLLFCNYKFHAGHYFIISKAALTNYSSKLNVNLKRFPCSPPLKKRFEEQLLSFNTDLKKIHYHIDQFVFILGIDKEGISRTIKIGKFSSSLLIV